MLWICLQAIYEVFYDVLLLVFDCSVLPPPMSYRKKPLKRLNSSQNFDYVNNQTYYGGGNYDSRVYKNNFGHSDINPTMHQISTSNRNQQNFYNGNHVIPTNSYVHKRVNTIHYNYRQEDQKPNNHEIPVMLEPYGDTVKNHVNNSFYHQVNRNNNNFLNEENSKRYDDCEVPPSPLLLHLNQSYGIRPDISQPQMYNKKQPGSALHDADNDSNINYYKSTSPDIRKRKSVNNDQIPVGEESFTGARQIPDYCGGLKGSQPLVTLNRYNLLLSSDGRESKSRNADGIVRRKSGACPPNSHREENPTNIIRQRSRTKEDITATNISIESFRNKRLVSTLSSWKDLHIVKLIGGGGFGKVYLGEWRNTPVAVKVLQVDETQQSNDFRAPNKPKLDHVDSVLQSFEEEIQILEKLRHPNICLFMGVCAIDGNGNSNKSNRLEEILPNAFETGLHGYAIITEYVIRGSLWDALRMPLHEMTTNYKVNRSSTGQFFWPDWLIRKVLEGTSRGLIYLHCHQPPIIHRDLKSPNLLLDESFNVKICDFGLAKLRDLTSVLTANVGTVQWMAPEVLTGQHYNESVDIYSLAMVTWELLTGKCPYESMQQVEIALAVVNQDLRPTIPATATQGIKDFLQRCWSKSPTDRPTAIQFSKELNQFFRS